MIQIASTCPLTTGADTGKSYTGNTGDDSFVSTVGTNGLTANGTTLNSGDVLNGGDGTDTLSIAISGTNTAAVGTTGVTLASIENISVSNFQTDDAQDNTISLAQASGVAKIAVTASASTGDTAFTGARSIVAAEMGNGAGDLSIQYTDDALAGASDTQTLVLSGQTAGEFSATAATKGIEALAITSGTAANTVKVTGAMTSIAVAGDKNLTLTEGAANTLTSVNAKNFTGNLKFTTDDVTDIAVTGGAGNDTLVLGATYTSADSIDGGAGNDSLSVAGSTVTSETSLKNVTGVETLVLTGASTVALTANVSATTFTVSDAGASDLTLGKGYTNATTVNIGTGDKVTNTANVALTVAGTDALVAGASVVGGTGVDSLNLKAASQVGTGVSLANLTGLETITIVDGGDSSTDAAALKGSDIQITTGAYANATTKAVTLSVNASALDAGTVTSDVMGVDDETINLNASGITNVLVSINATGGAGADTISGGAGNDVISGGAGNDALTSGNGNNSVDGGDGADTLTAGTGNDSLSGGLGNDKLDLGANLTKNDVVDGGDGVDTLFVSNAVTSDDFAGVTNVENLVFSSNVTLVKNVPFTSFDSSAASGAQTVTLGVGYTNATTVTLGTGGDDVINTAGVALTVNGKDLAIADAGTTITGGLGADSLNVTTTKQTGETVAFTNITGIETLTIVDGGDNTSGTKALAGYDAVINLGAYNTALTVDASALDAGTVTGSGAEAVMGADDETLNLNGSTAIKALNVTGGAGADTIIGGTANDILSGGAGNDAITGSAGGDDKIDGGTGDDTIDMQATLTKADTIIGGEGNDTLVVSNAVTADDLVNVSGVENLSFTGTLSFNKNVSFTNFNLVQNPDVAQTLTFTKGYTNATTVTIDATDAVVDNGANIALTVSGTDANVAASTVTGGTGTSDTLNITTASQDGTAVAFAGRITGVEIVNVNDGGDNTSGTKALAGYDAVITLGAYATAVKVDASGLDAGTGNAAETLTLTASGATKALTVIGGAASDTINLASSLGNNVIDGGDGNDTITAGEGYDSISGGAGNDTIKFAGDLRLTSDDSVDGGTGVNTLQVDKVAGDSFFLNVSNFSKLEVTSSTYVVAGPRAQAAGITTFAGTSGTNNEVDASGYSVGVTMNTLDGSDTLTGGTGDDTFVFAGANLAATDVVKGGTGVDVIRLDNGSAVTGLGDAVTAEVGSLTGVESITVNDLGALDTAGDVSVSFNAAFAQNAITVDGSQLDAGETLTVDASANIADNILTTVNEAEVVSLIGGAGADTLTGGEANDNIQGGAGNDNLSGNGGDDTIDTGTGNNVVDGGAGNDAITGGSGNDALTGGTGNDAINAGAGADTLVGGAGADNLTGGDGVDVFKYTAQSESNASVYDTVVDFTRGTDLLDLQSTGLTVEFKGSANTGFDAQTLLTKAAGQVVFDKSTSSLWMDVNGDGVLNTSDMKVVLSNVTDFAASDLYANTPDLAAADDTGSSNSDNITSQTTALTFTGINTASSTVEVFDDADNDGVMDTGEKLGNATVTTTSWTYDAALAAGTHNIRSIETTKAGTVLASSAAVTVTVDTTAPVAAAATTYSGDNNSTITTAEAAAGFVITGTREVGATVTIAGQVVTTPSATTWSTTISPASVVGFGQGAENLTVVSTDTAGNVTNATVALTVAITGAAEASNLNTLDASTATVVDATNVTSISGAAAVVETATASAGISRAANHTVTITDAQTGAAGVTAINAIAARTTGAVTANVSGTAAELAALENQNNTITATVGAGAATAANLNAIDDRTSVAVVATAVTGITGTATDVEIATASAGITRAADYTVNITDAQNGAAGVTAINAIAARTTGAVTASVSGTAAELAALENQNNTITATVGAGAATAANLNAIDARTSVAVVATAVTGITGTAADVETATASAGISRAADYTVNITDAQNGAAGVTAINAIAARTTGAVTATVTGTATQLAQLENAINTINATVSAGAVTASDLAAIDARTSVAVAAANATAINGTAAEMTVVTDALTAGTIVHGGNWTSTVSGTATVAEVNAIDAQNGTGVITATISTGAAATLAGLTATGATSAYTVTVTDTTATAANLNAINAATTVAVGATAVTTVTGLTADVETFVAADTAGTINEAANYAITLDGGQTATVAQANAWDAENGTGVITAALGNQTIANALTLTREGNVNAYSVTVTDATTVAQFNDLDALTSGTITVNNLTDGFQNIAAAPAIALTRAVAITANGTGIANTIDLSALTVTGKLTVLAGDGDDTVFGGTGADTINGGAGVDTITLGAGADIVVIGATDLTNANRDVVTDFVVADDSIRVDATLVNAGTGDITDGVVAGEYQTAAAAAAYTVGANEVVLELNFEFDANVTLATATKADILSALGAADNAGAGVTAGTLAMTAAGDEALVIAYQGGDAYLFRVTSGADADITVADGDDTVVLVGTYQNVAVGAFTNADFIA